MRGNPLFVQKGAPRTATMHQGVSLHIEGSHLHDACWLHAQWTRTPSGKNSKLLSVDHRIVPNTVNRNGPGGAYPLTV
jgi:hypothetical protein